MSQENTEQPAVHKNTWALSFGINDLVPEDQLEAIESIEELSKSKPRFIGASTVEKRAKAWSVPEKDKKKFYEVCLRLLKKGYGNKRIIRIAKRIGLLSYCSHGTYQHHIKIVRHKNGFSNRRVVEGTIQNRVVLLNKKGVSSDGIAQILGMEKSEVDCRIKNDRYRKQPVTSHSEKRQMYIDYANQGLLDKEIAKKMNVGVYAVQRQIKKLKSLGYIK